MDDEQLAEFNALRMKMYGLPPVTNDDLEFPDGEDRFDLDGELADDAADDDAFLGGLEDEDLGSDE